MISKIQHFSQLSDEIPQDLQRGSCGICCVKMILDFYGQSLQITDLIKEAEIIKAFNRENQYWNHEGLIRILRNHGVMSYAQEFRATKVILETGEMINSYDSSLVHNSELQGKSPEIVELRNQLKQKGFQKIMAKLANQEPVIASVGPNFGRNTDKHLIVLQGVVQPIQHGQMAENTLIINDPLASEEQEITQSNFLEYWTNLVLFTEKN